MFYFSVCCCCIETDLNSCVIRSSLTFVLIKVCTVCKVLQSCCCHICQILKGDSDASRWFINVSTGMIAVHWKTRGPFQRVKEVKALEIIFLWCPFTFDGGFQLHWLVWCFIYTALQRACIKSGSKDATWLLCSDAALPQDYSTCQMSNEGKASRKLQLVPAALWRAVEFECYVMLWSAQSSTCYRPYCERSSPVWVLFVFFSRFQKTCTAKLRLHKTDGRKYGTLCGKHPLQCLAEWWTSP